MILSSRLEARSARVLHPHNLKCSYEEPHYPDSAAPNMRSTLSMYMQRLEMRRLVHRVVGHCLDLLLYRHRLCGYLLSLMYSPVGGGEG